MIFVYGVNFQFRLLMIQEKIGYGVSKGFGNEPCIVSVGLGHSSVREVEAVKIRNAFCYDGHDDEKRYVVGVHVRWERVKVSM